VAEGTLGQAMRDWREAAGLTQAEAAEQLGQVLCVRIRQSQWSMWESGARIPDPLRAYGIRAALKSLRHCYAHGLACDHVA